MPGCIQNMRFPNFSALLSLLLAVALLYLSAPLKNTAPASRSVQWLDDTDVALFQNGLLHRHDVNIRVSNMELARGYSRSGCDGILLVAQLPNAAQGWNYIAPNIELEKAVVRYFYAGETYTSAPVMQKLAGWLVGSLPGFFEPREPVVGLAEFGHCHLIERAVPVLAMSGQAMAGAGS